MIINGKKDLKQWFFNNFPTKVIEQTRDSIGAWGSIQVGRFNHIFYFIFRWGSKEHGIVLIRKHCGNVFKKVLFRLWVRDMSGGEEADDFILQVVETGFMTNLFAICSVKF